MSGSSGWSAIVMLSPSSERSSSSSSTSPCSQFMGCVSVLTTELGRPVAMTMAGAPMERPKRVKSSLPVGQSGPDASFSSPLVSMLRVPRSAMSSAMSFTCTGWKRPLPSPGSRKSGVLRSTHEALFIRIDSPGVSPKRPQDLAQRLDGFGFASNVRVW